MRPKQTYNSIVFLPCLFLPASKTYNTMNHLAKLNMCSKQGMSAPGKASAHTAQVEDVKDFKTWSLLFLPPAQENTSWSTKQRLC